MRLDGVSATAAVAAAAAAMVASLCFPSLSAFAGAERSQSLSAHTVESKKEAAAWKS